MRLFSRLLRRRYGHAGHPLLPRLVVYLERVPKPGGRPGGRIRPKIQRHYGGAWETLSVFHYDSIPEARRALHEIGERVAERERVPLAHVEYVT